MILDTSALLAILFHEAEASSFTYLVERADVVRMSAASYLEAAMVIDHRLDAKRRAMLDSFLEQCEVIIEPVTERQARLARQAFNLFGKGRHMAALNYGDCFSYALAKDLREPLLYKGRDFSSTDIEEAN